MKAIVSGLFVAAVMSGVVVQAEDLVRTEGANEPYVVEPVFEANNWNCPRGTKVIAKYCWESIYGSFMRCGYVCHPVENPNHGGSPTSP